MEDKDKLAEDQSDSSIERGWYMSLGCGRGTWRLKKCREQSILGPPCSTKRHHVTMRLKTELRQQQNGGGIEKTSH